MRARLLSVILIVLIAVAMLMLSGIDTHGVHTLQPPSPNDPTGERLIANLEGSDVTGDNSSSSFSEAALVVLNNQTMRHYTFVPTKGTGAPSLHRRYPRTPKPPQSTQPKPSATASLLCGRWLSLATKKQFRMPQPVEVSIPVVRTLQGRPRRIWWRPSKAYPTEPIPEKYPFFQNVTISGYGFTNVSLVSGAALVLCPGLMTLRITCSDCLAMSGPINDTLRWINPAPPTTTPTDEDRIDIREGTMLQPSEDTFIMNASLLPRSQPVWEDALRDLGIGPDGFVGRLVGPEHHMALGRLCRREIRENDALCYTVSFNVGSVGHVIRVGRFRLSVKYVWSRWLHVLQHQHYSVTEPIDLFEPLDVHVVLPPTADASQRDRGIWQRFDTVPYPGRDNEALAHYIGDRLRQPQPQRMVVHPFFSGKSPTHFLSCMDGWLWWRHPSRFSTNPFVSPEVWRGGGQLPFNVSIEPAPIKDCIDTATVKLIPPGSCHLRRSIWRILNLSNNQTKRKIFDGSSLAIAGESQSSQLQRQIEALASGDLTDHVLLLDPAAKIAQLTMVETNNAVIPFSNIVATGKASIPLSFFAVAPVSKIPERRETRSGVRLTSLAYSEHHQLNLSRVTEDFLSASYVGFMFCQFCIIRGMPLEEYETRFTRFLLGLHGIGPDAVSKRRVSASSIVYVVACPPPGLRNLLPGRKPFADYYRIKYHDHRTIYAVELFVRSAKRVVDYVNLELASRGLPRILFLDYSETFRDQLDAAYDGDHFFGTDVNLAVVAMFLFDLAAERLRRDNATGILL